jgi:hypothetical protein
MVDAPIDRPKRARPSCARWSRLICSTSTPR